MENQNNLDESHPVGSSYGKKTDSDGKPLASTKTSDPKECRSLDSIEDTDPKDSSPTADPDFPDVNVIDPTYPVEVSYGFSDVGDYPPLDPPYPFHTRPSTSQTRRILTLDEKLQLIDVFESRTHSIKEIMKQFKCGKTQIYETIRKKQELIDLRSRSADGKLKRVVRVCANEDINNKVYSWYLGALAQNLPITGPTLQAVAKTIAEKDGNQDFKASNGWLNSFRRRYSVQLSNSYNRHLRPKRLSDAESALGVPFTQDTSEDQASNQSGADLRDHALVPVVEMRVYEDGGFGMLRRDETDESILQSLPDLGIVKEEPPDSSDFSAAEGESSNSSIPEPSPSSYSTPSSQSHELPSLSTILQTPHEVKHFILPDTPSSQTLMQSPINPAAIENSPEQERKIAAPTSGRKRRKSNDSDKQQKKSCNGDSAIRDEFSIFGEFVARKLRSLKSRQNQMLSKERIKQMLIDFEMKEFKDGSEISSYQPKSSCNDSRGSSSQQQFLTSHQTIPQTLSEVTSPILPDAPSSQPSLPTIPQTPSKVTSSISPDALSSQTRMQSPVHPATVENSLEPLETIAVATPSLKCKKSEHSDNKLQKSCGDGSGFCDEFLIFSEFVSRKLRSLKSRQYQMLSQERIKQVLIDFEMKEFEDGSVVSSHQPKKSCHEGSGIRDEFSIFGGFMALKLGSLKNRQYQKLAQERIKQVLIDIEMKEFEDES